MQTRLLYARDSDKCITRDKMSDYEYVQMRSAFTVYFQNQGHAFMDVCPTIDETVDKHIYEKKNPFISQRRVGDKENVVEL